ncbi:hypothetical protein [Nocardia brevicatena]|uniref:hypothetical protein n=1 Tax=Nocardia brevicatena TaxID=37327 RepID=UPI000301E687|nr:hypothetical protein [Nocardia brevicatena]
MSLPRAGDRARANAAVRSSAVADSKQTPLCTYLWAVLLTGLLSNSVFGRPWADPIAAGALIGVACGERFLLWPR